MLEAFVATIALANPKFIGPIMRFCISAVPVTARLVNIEVAVVLEVFIDTTVGLDVPVSAEELVHAASKFVVPPERVPLGHEVSHTPPRHIFEDEAVVD